MWWNGTFFFNWGDSIFAFIQHRVQFILLHIKLGKCSPTSPCSASPTVTLLSLPLPNPSNRYRAPLAKSQVPCPYSSPKSVKCDSAKWVWTIMK